MSSQFRSLNDLSSMKTGIGLGPSNGPVSYSRRWRYEVDS